MSPASHVSFESPIALLLSQLLSFYSQASVHSPEVRGTMAIYVEDSLREVKHVKTAYF